jgi:hypothetical protein
MGEFRREHLPTPQAFFESCGLTLTGRGAWRTTSCQFHGGSDSMRINVTSGAWVCMNCLEKGHDVLAYTMRLDGLHFVEAARKLGAYVEDGKPRLGPTKPSLLGARDAMEVIAAELGIAVIVIGDIKRGIVPSDGDWDSFLQATSNVEALVGEFRT